MKYVFIFILLISQLFSISDEIQLELNRSLLSGSKVLIGEKEQKFEKLDLKNFIIHNKKNIHLGYSDKSVWVYLEIKNSTNKKTTYYIENSNWMLDEFFLYEKIDGKYKVRKNGLNYRKAFNGIFNFYFKIDLNPNELKQIYIKTQSISSANWFELTLLDEDSFLLKESKDQFIITLFFGFIIALILYNLAIFFQTKNRAYIFYAFYIGAIALHHSFYTPAAHLFFDDYNFLLALALSDFYYYVYSSLSITAALFAREFLNTKIAYPKIDKYFLFLIAISFLAAFFTTHETLYLSNYLHQFIMLTLWGVGVYLLTKKYRGSIYFTFGWGLSVLALSALSFYNSGDWFILDNYPYFFEFFIALEGILFSYALAQKIKEKDSEILEVEKRHSKELEERINETTKDLKESLSNQKILIKELHHRVKNNMQIIMSLYDLKLDLEDNQKLIEVENIVRSMSKVHELLYKENNLEEIDSEQYINTLIETIKQSFLLDEKNISIDCEAKGTLTLESGISIGVILNELITNSIKHAFPNNQKGVINISVKSLYETIKVIVKDNGVGIAEDRINASFGLSMLQQMVKKQLNGKIKFFNNNGAVIDIELKKTNNK